MQNQPIRFLRHLSLVNPMVIKKQKKKESYHRNINIKQWTFKSLVSSFYYIGDD